MLYPQADLLSLSYNKIILHIILRSDQKEGERERGSKIYNIIAKTRLFIVYCVPNAVTIFIV